MPSLLELIREYFHTFKLPSYKPLDVSPLVYDPSIILYNIVIKNSGKKYYLLILGIEEWQKSSLHSFYKELKKAKNVFIYGLNFLKLYERLELTSSKKNCEFKILMKYFSDVKKRTRELINSKNVENYLFILVFPKNKARDKNFCENVASSFFKEVLNIEIKPILASSSLKKRKKVEEEKGIIEELEEIAESLKTEEDFDKLERILKTIEDLEDW